MACPTSLALCLSPCSLAQSLARSLVHSLTPTHAGDVRVVEAVDIPALRYARNVLLFSRHGDRPLPNMLSGSDLDGDLYAVR